MLRKAGTSLAVQWLRFHTASAWGVGLIPGQGTRTKISHATQFGQKFFLKKAKEEFQK